MSELLDLLNDNILDNPHFVSAIFSGEKTGPATAWERIVIKPVLLKDVLQYQINYYDAKQSTTKNYTADALPMELRVLESFGFKSVYIRDNTSGLQIQVHKKGKLFVKRHKEQNTAKADLSHNRTKNKIIQNNADDAYLKALGFTDTHGQIKPTMQAKFKQINEFVKLIADLQDWTVYDQDIRLIDCGSGNAYLTFAAFHYFQNVLGKKTYMTGLDINAKLIENSNARATELGWDNLTFEVTQIGNYTPTTPPTIVLALHACDTATDEALMKAVQWDATHILSAPCCHHNLQERLKDTETQAVFKGTFKHGILRERMGDILTDTFRALLLEIMGYKTDIIEFIATEHTARNLMIRARKTRDGKTLPGSLANYRALKEFWNVTPALEDKLVKTSDLPERLG